MHHRLTKSLRVPTFVFLAAATVVFVAHEVRARPAIDQPGARMVNSTDLGKRLYAIADYWGDSLGRIDFTVTGTNQTNYVALADPAGAFSIFYNGQNVPDGSSMAACVLDDAGAPVHCDLAYGEALLLALEDLVDEQADPTEMTIACHSNEGGVTHTCVVTWSDGSSSCYRCVPNSSGGTTCTNSCS